MAQDVSAVGRLPVRSHLGHVEVSLNKTPNPQRAGWYLAWQPIAVGV